VRSALTALAIVLGVAMISGAYTLTDTMGGAADSLSKASYNRTEAVVTARTAFKAESDNGFATAPTVSEAVLAKVRAVPEVAVAAGDLTDEARMVSKKGKVLGSGPYFGVGYDASVPGAGRLSPFRLQSGHFATKPGEVVIDQGTAKDEKVGVGDTIRVVTRGPAQPFRVTGVATFGAVKSIGTATFAIFDVHVAQKLFKKPGRYDDILVGGRPGISKAAVRVALARALPAGLAVQSAEKQDRFTLDGLKDFIGFIKTFLLVFGGVAVFVGAFTIFNTLSITVAQRSREFAMLRTIGATRRQILKTVMVEAFVVGTFASLVGLFVGLGLAKLLSSLLASFGLDLPQTGLVFSTRTIVVALLVGVIVTVLAGLGPALRATRVSPVTALRDGAEVPPGRVGRRAPQIAVALTALALVLLGLGLFSSVDDTTRFAAFLGPGVLLLFIGIALLSPRFVTPLASLLGRPAQRMGGAAGALARRNAERNPGRTAVTASALMIGIALVSFVTVLGAGLRESTSGSLKKEIRSDYVLVGSDGYSPIAPEAARAAASVPGVTISTGVKQDVARIFGKKHSVDGVDPARFVSVFHQEYTHGSDADVRSLGADGAVVNKSFADDHHLSVGERFTALTISRKRLSLVVRAVSDPAKFNPLGLGDVTIAESTFAPAFPTQRERYAFVKVDGGSSPSATRALTAAMRAFPDVKVQTKAKFQKDQAAFVDQILQILYVLLALAVIVSLFGIVNTLVLSVFERTRELGMLRAVGMSRRQVRRMIRHESVITALIGAVLGIVVGLFLAALVTTALSKEGLQFALPIGSLAAFMVVAALAGILAAIAPARRAARLNVLDALQYE
jgi:putative ABC transport system permease protein